MTSESSFLAGRGIPDMLLQLVPRELVKQQNELCFRFIFFSIFAIHARSLLHTHTMASHRQRIGRQFKREPHDASHHGPYLGVLRILSLISGVQPISLVLLIVLLGLLFFFLGFFGLVDPSV